MVRSFRCFICCLLALPSFSSTNAQSHIHRDGYVTQVLSPSSFRLNQQQVITTPSTQLFITSTTPPVEETFSIASISPGSHLFVFGVEDNQTHIITAKKIDLVEGALNHLGGLGIEDSAPKLAKDGTGWRGSVYSDGYEITVEPETKVQLSQGIRDPSIWNPNLWIAYKATRQRDGSILASQLSFIADDNIADEQRFRDSNDFKIEPPDYEKGQPGKVHFSLRNFRILPDRKLQDAINAFGQKLVPAWQQKLPDTDPAKIHFRFFVLEKSKALETTLSDDAGTVLIPSQIIAKLENEAQLASLLSADIAGALEKDTYRSRTQKHAQEAIDIALIPSPLGQMINNGAFSEGYWTPLTEHECRVGLRYVVAAGYDPREAPIALQRISEKHPDVKADKPLSSRANYADAELGFDYMTTDFASLRKGESGYIALRNMTLAADPKLKKD